MKLNDSTFPYPVLSSDTVMINDDKFVDNNYFNVNVTQNLVGQANYELALQYILKNDELQTLINNGKAEVVAHIESSLSSFRKVVPFSKEQDILKVKVNLDEMISTVDLTILVVVNKDIKEYKNSGFNEELLGENYSVKDLRRGDILAYNPTIKVTIETEDSVTLSTKTFIKLAKTDKAMMEVNLDSQDIMINLPKDSYNAYSSLQNTKEEKLASATLLLPALIIAIDDLKDKESTNEEYLWYTELQGYIYDVLKYDDQSLVNAPSIKVAQEVLDNPINSAFSVVMEEEE